MLDHFGLPDHEARLHNTIETTTGAGILTREVGAVRPPPTTLGRPSSMR
ncbi:hypothetical protein ACRAWF_32810 [Streptomyces sp. L7]